jgi:recombinational DNA repair protein (RecF pathway)
MRRRHRAGTGFVLWQLPVHKHLTRLKLLCSYESLFRIVAKGGEKRKKKTARGEKNFSSDGV